MVIRRYGAIESGCRYFRWRRCLLRWFCVEPEVDQRTSDHQQEGNDLRLGGLEPKDVVFGVDPDLFYEEPFYSIDKQVDTKQRTRHLQSLPQEPEQEEQSQANHCLIKRRRENRYG